MLTWVLVQRIVLSAALTRRRELDWSKLSESGMLPAGITYDDQKLPQARWKWEIFSKADAAANSSTKRQQRDVILLHGFGSSGRRAWGTLPIMLLDHRKVNRVHVLSYPAHPAGKIPFTGHRTDQLIRELRLVLLEIAAKYRGEPHTKFAIFAHSLGGMLAASVVGASRDANIKQEERRLFARICKLVLIMSPVEGVRMARLGFPWRFPYALRPGSPFVLESMNSMKRLVTGDAYSGHAVELWIGSQDWLVDVNKLGAHYPGIAKEVLGDHSTWSSLIIEDCIQLETYANAIDDGGQVERDMQEVGLALQRLSGDYSYIVCRVDDSGGVSTVIARSAKYEATANSFHSVMELEFAESSGGAAGWPAYRKMLDAAIGSMEVGGRSVVRVNRANRDSGTIVFRVFAD